MKAPVLLGAAVLLLAGTGAAEAQFRVCNHNEWFGAHTYIAEHMELSWSNQGNGAPDTASWDDLSVNTFNKAWRGWWELDTSNPAVWLGPNTTNNTYNSLPDFVSLFQKATNLPAGLAGQTQWFNSAIFSSVITEVDIRVQGATTLSSPPGLNPITAQEACAHNQQTQAGVMVHELGHAYGYAHWFDWLSMMNSGQADVLSCERPTPAGSTQSMRLTPDALSSQCHDIQYGLTAGVDFGGTPVRQVCALTSGGCASVLDTLMVVDPALTLAGMNVEYTTFSNRDSFAAAVPYRMVLSTDNVVSGDDVEVRRNSLVGWSAGATTFRRLFLIFNPQTAMPLLNTTYRVLIQLDPDNVIAEARESNNVIDTRVRVRRQ